MPMSWLAAGSLYCALAVVAGAFGAHALSSRLSAENLALWETAARYLMYGGFGLWALGLSERALGQVFSTPGWLLLVGTGVFSGTVFALALGSPRWFGAVTPIGGVLMICAFVAFAISVLR